MTRILAAALGLALAGCGNYSTEDLRFLAALPMREHLQVAVPADGNPGAATVCGPGLEENDVWIWAKPTSDGLNAGVGFVVSLIDVVRRHPPTDREENLRRWGPFPDEKHPGIEIRIVLERSYPDGSDARPVHHYAFEARRVADPTFDPLIVGTFEGASASRGRGTVDLYFENFHGLGLDDENTPHGTMRVAYDRASDPVTIELVLTDPNGGFGIPQFAYKFAGYRAGGGSFEYRFRRPNWDVLTVATGFDAAGAGRAEVTYDPFLPGPTGSFRECWDAGACLTYVDDEYNYSETCGGAPCYIDGPCAPVPAPPFEPRPLPP